MLGLRARALDSAARRLAGRLPAVTHAVLHFEGTVEEYFCEDRFHPSVRGYASWGEQLAQAALPLLETPPMEMAAALSSGSRARATSLVSSAVDETFHAAS